MECLIIIIKKVCRYRKDVIRDFDVILMLCCWRNVTRKLLIKLHMSTQWIHVWAAVKLSSVDRSAVIKRLGTTALRGWQSTFFQS